MKTKIRHDNTLLIIFVNINTMIQIFKQTMSKYENSDETDLRQLNNTNNSNK